MGSAGEARDGRRQSELIDTVRLMHSKLTDVESVQSDLTHSVSSREREREKTTL